MIVDRMPIHRRVHAHVRARAQSLSKKQRRSIDVVSVLVLILVALGVWHVSRPSNESMSLVSNESPVTLLLGTVGEHVLLPEGEVPRVLRVEDAARMAGEQAFYANAQDGDLLLLFEQSARAVLWRPETRVVVNSGPINVRADAGGSTSSTPLTVAIRNGTRRAGYAAEVADMLSAYPEYSVVEIGNAHRTHKGESVLFSSGDAEHMLERVHALALMLDVPEVRLKMPEGEPVSDADVLLILGK